MKISDFKNTRVTIMGLGIVGGGADTAKFFIKAGARVLVTDLKTKKELKVSLKKIKGLPVKLVLGKHRKQDFINTDLVIRNPGVPDDSSYLKIANKNKVPIDTDIGIFFELCPRPIIGVTGTKGKSTVVTLLHQLLKSKYSDVILGGNIGNSPLGFLRKIKQDSKIVLELSSWQLEGLIRHKKSPQTALITNIYPEHLNRYKSFGDYIKAKKLIFSFQNPKDFLFLNYDNPIVKKFSKQAKSRVRFFTTKKIPEDLRKIIRELKITGEHNISNISAAYSVAKLYKVPLGNIRKALKNFEWPEGRQEYIKEIKGVKYFNDTTATMPEAAIAAIETISQRFPKSKIILISGGVDKNLNYKNLAKKIAKKVSYLILFSGTASEKIKKELFNIKRPKKLLSAALDINSMQEAVKLASNMAKKWDIVLLSPAAASFNLFKNEFDRGSQFNKAVRKL